MVDANSHLVPKRIIQVACEIIINLPVADRRTRLSVKCIKTIIGRIKNNAPKWHGGVTRNRASLFFNIILAKIPNNAPADIYCAPDAAFLEYRRIIQANKAHNLAALLI